MNMIFHIGVTVTKFYMWLYFLEKTVALSLQNLYAFIQGSTSFSYLEKEMLISYLFIRSLRLVEITGIGHKWAVLCINNNSGREQK